MRLSRESEDTERTHAVKNREQLSRVYSQETWRVYDLLDQSLAPRGPDSLYDLAGEYLEAGCKVLDAGCRDAAHLIRLVGLYDVTGVGVDPVDVHIEGPGSRSRRRTSRRTSRSLLA